MKIEPRKAFAIIDRGRVIHLDKVALSKAECWGILADEFSNQYMSIDDLKKNGYDCCRVEIRAVTRT